MEGEFCQYLSRLYNAYSMTRQKKFFYVHKSCYESDHVAIWEYGNVVHASSIIDYFYIVDDAEYRLTLDKAYGEVPELLYETEDETVISNIIDSFAEKDYLKRLENLYRTVLVGNRLSLTIDK